MFGEKGERKRGLKNWGTAMEALIKSQIKKPVKLDDLIVMEAVHVRHIRKCRRRRKRDCKCMTVIYLITIE